jgi:crotonobetaine/carnitine-CoA ligase
MDDAALQEFQMHGQDIPWLLDHWAEHRPDHPVLVWDPPNGVGREWTYAQLREDTRRLAAGLVARGIVKGDKVLVHADNCPELVLAWLACATVGAVGVTTNTKSVGAELTYFIDKARCVAAITQPKFAAMVVEAGPALQWVAVTADDSGEPAAADLSGLTLDAFDDLFGDESAWPGRAAEPLLPFGIMFTSGTTNKPKAVVHTHANAVWASRLGPRNIDLGPDDRYLVYLPFFHVNAQSWTFFPVLGVGATVVLTPKWSTSRFWDVVARHRITHISLMPFVMGTLAQADRPETELRVGVFGLIMPELDRMFGIDVYAAYGMTELVSHAITGKPSEQLPTRSMGHVAPGYEIAVVDKETGELCDEGQTGELWMRGTRGIEIFLEYFDNPEANATSFEDGWFKTGDMVQMGTGGNVFYQERDKDLIKVGGENVSAREVEEIVGTVPGVAQVAVVGKKHEWLDQVVVAFVITAPGAPEHAELEAQVIETCKGRLAEFKVPRAVYAVEEFPLGTLDKLLKNKLRDLADEQPDV